MYGRFEPRSHRAKSRCLGVGTIREPPSSAGAEQVLFRAAVRPRHPTLPARTSQSDQTRQRRSKPRGLHWRKYRVALVRKRIVHGQGASGWWRAFFASCTRSLSWRGFFYSIALPLSWLGMFYALVVHLRLSLGRWPTFGESFECWRLSAHSQATWQFAGALVASLYLVPLVLVGCLFFPRWRHLSIYSLTYSAAVGLSFGAMLLAPDPVLNWFFD